MNATAMQRTTALGLVADLARRTWLVSAVTVVACSAFAAHAATALVEADYLPPGSAGAPPATARPVRLRSPSERAQRVDRSDRNLFCSSCGPAGIAAPAAAVALVGQPAVLIATELAAENRATVRIVGTEVQGSWGVGDAIPGLGQLDRIGPMWIELVDGAGHRGRLSLLDAAASGDPAPVPDRAPASQRWAGRLNKLGEQDYEVDRALVRELVTTAGQRGAVPMIPLFEHGEIRGVRLGRVTADSIQDALGLKTGDILSAIDGAPLKTLDQLLDLYVRLDQLSALELSGTRNGKPLVRTLRLR
jgi:hypothetical protein